MYIITEKDWLITLAKKHCGSHVSVGDITISVCFRLHLAHFDIAFFSSPSQVSVDGICRAVRVAQYKMHAA